MKNILRTIVFILIAIGLGAWAYKNFFNPADKTASGTPKTPAGEVLSNQKEHTVVVTYFTSNQRCKTCRKIEKLTHDLIYSAFKDELKNKEIIFQTINFDDPENKHYMKDYNLSFKTVVVSDREKGKEVQWSKYDDVWKLHGNPEQFNVYLTKGIKQYLKPSSTDKGSTATQSQPKSSE